MGICNVEQFLMILHHLGLQGKIIFTQLVSEQDIQSPQTLPTRILACKYDRLFHFFFSKTIKKVVEKEECRQLSELKQFEFWDDDREMLKRSYDTQEFQDRIGILFQISHPQTKFNFHLIEPLVVNDPYRKIMMKRTKRIRKYEHKLQQIQEEVPVTFESKFLDTIDSRSEVFQISYASSYHDVFQDFGEEQDKVKIDLEKMARVCVRGLSVLGRNSQTLSEPPQHLTLDFDDINDEEIIFSYKKLTGKESFKKKYSNQDPKLSYRKKHEQTAKIEYYDNSVLTKPAHLSPKPYSNRVHKQKPLGKRITYLEMGNQSIETQNDSSKDIYKPNTLLELHSNHDNRQGTVNNPSSIRIPTTSNTTQFKAIRKRALELLAEEGQSLNSPKFAKAKSPATFSIQRLQR